MTIDIKQMLEKTASEVPQKTAIVFGSQRVSYRELDETSNRIANALIDVGLQKGDHVAILMPNRPEWIINYFGVVKAGGITVTLDPRLKVPELNSLLRDSDSKILITERRVSQTLSSVLPDICSLKRVIEIDGDSYQKIIANNSSVAPAVDINYNDETTIVYTSGVLGKQKGIVHTHAGIMSVLPAVISGIELEKNDIVLGMVPFCYLLGLFGVVLMSFMKGATIVTLPRFSSNNVLETVEQEKVTMLAGTPASYNALAVLDEDILKGYDLSSLRVVLTAGAKSSTHLMKMLEDKFGLTVFDIYGISEFLVVSFGAIHDRKLGTAGKPICELKVVDDNGIEVARGEIGEAVTRAPWVMKGYYKRPDLTAQIIKDGWFHTGDLVRIDEDGYLEYVGKKTFIIVTSGGVKISPTEVEDILLRHPSVAEAAYVGVTDEHRGQVPTAFITLKEGQDASAEEIRDFCRQNLADFKLPRQVKFVDSMPRTGSGEIDRRRLKEMEGS